ncbi:1-acyl-sn-glycerol-3-phosphate acyltransferase [Streptomyces goshikiensis]|uniref:1-acyl-sn-glycerol-3-phosphate acyltransferase n=1 Tax=Streptomyces goshikiensis TaxID=1942 RepID=UPI0036AF70EA
MLSRIADVLVPAVGRLSVTTDADADTDTVPVLRGDRRAAAALDTAAEALEKARLILIYAEGGLPRRKDAAESAPGPFRSGLARLAERTGPPVVPVGHAGARRVTSGGLGKQLAGLATAPLRLPGLHVHVGTPLRLTGDCQARTARARTAVTNARRGRQQPTWTTPPDRRVALARTPAR